MNSNIEKNIISEEFDIKKYWLENIDFIEKNPEILKIINLSSKIKENSKEQLKFNNLFEKISQIDKSNIELNKLKNTLA